MRGSRWPVAIGLAFTLIASACTSPATSQPPATQGGSATSVPGSGGASKPTIGFVVPLISNPYWKLIQDFAVGAAGTLGVTLLTDQADSDESKQISII